jgi:molecular chaperone GrpE
MWSADSNPFGASGPGESGAAPAAAAVSVAGEEPEPVAVTVAGEEPEPVAVTVAGEEPEPVAVTVAGEEPEPVAVPVAGEEPELMAVPVAGEEPEPVAVPAAPEAPEAAAEPEAENHEALLARDLEELTAKAQMADEYLELAQRTKADFENYRKRAARDAAAAQERGMVKLARELLPAVDNLDRALAAAQTRVPLQDGQPSADGSATLVSGIKLVHADVIAALARVGIEPFSPQGEQFDPQYHEAIAQQPIEGAAPGTVVEVYQPGFRLGESVLRPARVVVAG